jgi:hypothetical protein
MNNEHTYTARAVESGHQWRLYVDSRDEAAKEARSTAQSENYGIWPRRWVDDFVLEPSPGADLGVERFEVELLEDGKPFAKLADVEVGPPEPPCLHGLHGEHYWVPAPDGGQLCIYCGLTRAQQWLYTAQEDVHVYAWSVWMGITGIPPYFALPPEAEAIIKAREFDLGEALRQHHWVDALEVVADIWDRVEDTGLLHAKANERDGVIRSFRSWLKALGKEHPELVKALRGWSVHDDARADLRDALRGR